jgi:hypothetical protein
LIVLPPSTEFYLKRFRELKNRKNGLTFGAKINDYLILTSHRRIVLVENPLLKFWASYMKTKEASEFRLEWISIGPVMNSARVEAVQADPSNPDTMYTALGSGNLWKSVNGGLTWIPVFENQSALGIGWYFAGCYVNPKDDEEVFALGVCLAHSTEGGRIFKLVGGDGCYTARNYVFKSLTGATTGGRNTREGDLCDEPAAHPGSL